MRVTTMVFFATLAAAAGCAHKAPTSARAQPSPAVTDAYRTVRAGAQRSAEADGYLFCATARGLDVVSTKPSESAEWADIERDRHIESEVRTVLKADPELRDQNIQVKTTRGEVWLSGSVASDAQALHATKQALGVDGVVFVNVALSSPDSPGPVARVENPEPRCLL